MEKKEISGESYNKNNEIKLKLDDLDYKIIDMLARGGRIPNNEIASQLSISEGTVRNRIKKLTDANFLKVKGLTNPDFGSTKQLIIILITLERTKNWKARAEEISRLPNVKSVSMTTGRFDVICEVFIEPHDLITFLTEELGSVNDISSTESLVTILNFNKWV
jgi:Lrp/AsnC family transcriptional regulator for asnA, asnC and gidA